MTNVASIDTRSGGGIAIVQTSPDSITLHRIEDHELVVLMNIARPYALAFSTMTGGAFLGLLPSTMTICEKAARGVTNSELVTLLIAGACLASAIIFGVYAVRGLVDANRAIRKIRSRPTSPA